MNAAEVLGTKADDPIAVVAERAVAVIDELLPSLVGSQFRDPDDARQRWLEVIAALEELAVNGAPKDDG